MAARQGTGRPWLRGSGGMRGSDAGFPQAGGRRRRRSCRRPWRGSGSGFAGWSAPRTMRRGNNLLCPAGYWREG
eukprot:4435227-Alexandrium_andersonii.AAC.1